MRKKYTASDLIVISKTDSNFQKIDITKESFKKNLITASCYTLEFTKSLVFNYFPEKIRYKVILGQSLNKIELKENEKNFHEDNKSLINELLNSDSVISLLWRDGMVPEWINVSVDSADSEYTYIKLECCGRFSNDPKFIYHAHEGLAPFHVLGPRLPPKKAFRNSENKFDFYWYKKR